MVVCGRRVCTRSDPGARQIGQRREVGFTGQPSGLKTAHLAGRGGLTIQAGAVHHSTHRRIMGETLGIVHVLIPGKAAEHGLAEQAGQHVPGILAAAAFRQRRPRDVGQPERVVQLTVCEQSSVGGDAGPMKFQLQAAVEFDPQKPVIRFTRWVFHSRTSDSSINA